MRVCVCVFLRNHITAKVLSLMVNIIVIAAEYGIPTDAATGVWRLMNVDCSSGLFLMNQLNNMARHTEVQCNEIDDFTLQLHFGSIPERNVLLHHTCVLDHGT